MDDTEEDVVMPAPPPPSSCLINKGKRTKRQRPLSPIPISAIPAGDHLMTTFSDDSTTTEEEDTARCLILLAQGRHFPTNNNNQLFPKRSSKIIRHDQETTTTTCMYECKTCNRVFRSFQALGGHRASHRKPKNDQKKPAAVFSDEEEYPFKKLRLTTTPSSNSLQLANVKPQHPSPRIHECSYCGAEFTSGQALGGHMRRHRAAGPVISSSNPVVTDPNEPKKPRNGLSLDLNLPAPDDHENQRFGFGARQQKGPVLSTSNALALVNCHY